MTEPGADLLSRLAARVDSGEPSRTDAAQMGVLLSIAGHETTADMIALGTLALLEHRVPERPWRPPARWRRSRPNTTDPSTAYTHSR
jgi:cytochrome P450